MSTDELFISVILPVYNQAGHVEEIVQEYQASLERVPNPHEIILVVNGSTDRSLEICRSIEERSSNVKVLESQEAGWGRAVLMGLKAAQGELLCYTNLARTSAKDLTLLLLYATVHPDVVIKANRKIRDSFYRRLGSLLYNLECRALFDLSYWDINGTPKVFPRAFRHLTELSREDDLIDIEFSVICRERGYPVLEVPIFSNLRRTGNSTTSLFSALKMYWGAIKLWRASPR